MPIQLSGLLPLLNSGFRSFAAWSTPFLNTDQNEPVSPCVTKSIASRRATRSTHRTV